MATTRYRRVLLKLSGEALMGHLSYGIDTEVVRQIAAEIRSLVEHGVETIVVVGGGNIFRGFAASAKGMDRATADYVGMLATVMNALTLQDSLEKQGIVTRVQSAIEMRAVAEPFIRRRAMRHIEKGRVVIFAAGTGNPYFSTDMAAALRAAEIGAEVLLKATKVDGVYESDPVTNPDAKKYSRISYSEVLSQNLAIMDSSAIALCRDNKIPIIVFNLRKTGNMVRVVTGEDMGTVISDDRTNTAFEEANLLPAEGSS